MNPNLKENKLKRALALPLKPFFRLFPTSYVKHQYKYITHHKLNLKNPTRYTEKLQYLRLYVYPKNPLVSKAAGRAGVREYLTEKGLGEYLVPIYGVYDKFEDIDFNKLPNQFVMKCTHACAFNQIVLDKSKLNIKESKKKFNKWLKTNYGRMTMERHYSPIKPQIIIEKYLGFADDLPIEYKIHVFNGKAKYIYVVSGRGKDIRYNNCYIDWTPFDGAQFNGWKKREPAPIKPDNWDAMVKLAEKMAEDFPFVRVDLYNINGKIYFSELTFTPAKGTLIFDDDKADFEISEWLVIKKYLK